MVEDDSIALVRRAREGDREAWEVLCARHYPRWLRRYHGQLGDTLRAVWETQDLVQSAVREALRDIASLRSETAFFAWVSTIVRRKITEKRRLAERVKAVGFDDLDILPHADGRPGSKVEAQEEEARLLDGMLALFPRYPDHMAAVYMKYFAEWKAPAMAEVFGKSERSVQRYITSGMLLLKSTLGGAGESV